MKWVFLHRLVRTGRWADGPTKRLIKMKRVSLHPLMQMGRWADGPTKPLIEMKPTGRQADGLMKLLVEMIPTVRRADELTKPLVEMKRVFLHRLVQARIGETFASVAPVHARSLNRKVKKTVWAGSGQRCLCLCPHQAYAIAVIRKPTFLYKLNALHCITCANKIATWMLAKNGLKPRKRPFWRMSHLGR